MEPQLNIPEELRHDFRGLCWWCQTRPADSKEHRYKRSDLTQVFGKRPWRGDHAIVRGGTGGPYGGTAIQGPNSKHLKFERVLCEKCNNANSQPFDLAYSTFTSYVDEHAKDILASNSFRFSDVYGPQWQWHRANLNRYFIKHIGCRLAEKGVQLPARLVRYLDSETAHNPPYLGLIMEIRLDIVAMDEHLVHEGLEPGGLWIGATAYRHNSWRVTAATSFLGYTWLRIYYEMDRQKIRQGTNFDGDLVILPEDYNIEPDHIRDMCAVCSGHDGRNRNLG